MPYKDPIVNLAKAKERSHNMNKLCPDCGAPVTNVSIRCRTCNSKTRVKPDKFCVDCGKQIGRQYTRCIRHSKSGEFSPLKGVFGSSHPASRLVGDSNPNWRGGLTYDPMYHKVSHHRRRVRMEAGGKLELKDIQKAYEENIKKFGTLTCYLCEIPIPFGNDELEHKIALARGGTNEYSNLAIACKSCNSRKHTKSEAEFRLIMETA